MYRQIIMIKISIGYDNGVPGVVVGGDTSRLFVAIPSGLAGNVPVASTVNGHMTELTAAQVH